MSAQLDDTLRLQPLSEHVEEITEITEGTQGLRILDTPLPSAPDTPFEQDDVTLPQTRLGFAKRFLSKSRQRASSIGKLQLSRPKLERREAGPGGIDDSSPDGSHSPTLFRSKRFKQLRGRLAFSAPVTPAFSPSPSTEKVHLFRSRPSSIVIKGSGQDLQASFYFDALPGSPLLDSPLASSCYVPALEELVSAEEEAIVESKIVDSPRDLFDSLLPREIRILIFAKVVENSIEEQSIRLDRGDWSAKIAAENRWVGESGGLRTLIGLSRVSREWRDLAFDGQLWQNVRLAKYLGCDVMSPFSLLRLASHAGPYLCKLDLRGYRDLQDEDVEIIANSCRAGSECTNLDYIDLTGRCSFPLINRSQLTPAKQVAGQSRPSLCTTC